MFRIRRIYDDVLPVNKEAIRQVQELFRQNFSAVRPEEAEGLAEKLRNPFKQQYRSVLYVAERRRTQVIGFAFLMHEPLLEFCYLDFMASARQIKGRGVGGALYHNVRQEAKALGVRGLFFECLPDAPDEVDDAEILQENVARLRFYERFGARPIEGTAYETPIREGQRGMPHLMFDGLDRGQALRPDFARKVVRAILERTTAISARPSTSARWWPRFATTRSASGRPATFWKSFRPERPGSRPESRSPWWSTTSTTSTTSANGATSRHRCGSSRSSASWSRPGCSSGSSREAIPSG